MEKVTNGIKVDLDLLRSRLLKDNLLSLAILLSAPLQVRCCYLDLYKCGNMLNEKLTQRRTSQMQQQNLRPLDVVVATGEKSYSGCEPSLPKNNSMQGLTKLGSVIYMKID